MKSVLLHFALLLTTFSGFSQSLSLPYSTGFDSPSQKAGWQQFRTGFLSTSGWGYGAGFSAPSSISHDYNVGGNQNDTVVDWFVSPPLNFSAGTVISMKVRVSGFSTPTVDNCEVWFGRNNPDPSKGNFVLIGNISSMNPKGQWLDTSFQNFISSDSGYIAFKYKTIGAAWATYEIDNLTIALNPASGTPEPVKTDMLSVYPNPVKATATILLSGNPGPQETEISIYNSFGQQIKTIQTDHAGEIKISRDDLQAGIYFFRVIMNGRLNTCKVVLE